MRKLITLALLVAGCTVATATPAAAYITPPPYQCFRAPCPGPWISTPVLTRRPAPAHLSGRVATR